MMKQTIQHHPFQIKRTQRVKLVEPVALGVILLSLMSACSDQSSDDNQRSSVEGNDSVSQSTNTGDASEHDPNLLKIEKAKITLSPEQQQNNAIEQLKALSQSHTAQIKALSDTLEQLKQSLQQVKQAAKEKNQESLLDLQAQINSLVEKQNALAVRPVEKKPVKKTRVRGKGYYLPTFHLVSIDQWGDDSIVVVSQKDQLHELRAGQSLDQWQIERINVEQASVVFKNPYGTRKTLYIEPDAL